MILPISETGFINGLLGAFIHSATKLPNIPTTFGRVNLATSRCDQIVH